MITHTLQAEILACRDCFLLELEVGVYWALAPLNALLCPRHSAMLAGHPYARPLTREELARE